MANDTIDLQDLNDEAALLSDHLGWGDIAPGSVEAVTIQDDDGNDCHYFLIDDGKFEYAVGAVDAMLWVRDYTRGTSTAPERYDDFAATTDMITSDTLAAIADKAGRPLGGVTGDVQDQVYPTMDNHPGVTEDVIHTTAKERAEEASEQGATGPLGTNEDAAVADYEALDATLGRQATAAERAFFRSEYNDLLDTEEAQPTDADLEAAAEAIGAPGSWEDDDVWASKVHKEAHDIANRPATITPGPRVETVGLIPEDSDTGVVHGINGDTATVGWDSGATTTAPLGDLRALD